MKAYLWHPSCTKQTRNSLFITQTTSLRSNAFINLFFFFEPGIVSLAKRYRKSWVPAVLCWHTLMHVHRRKHFIWTLLSWLEHPTDIHMWFRNDYWFFFSVNMLTWGWFALKMGTESNNFGRDFQIDVIWVQWHWVRQVTKSFSALVGKNPTETKA